MFFLRLMHVSVAPALFLVSSLLAQKPIDAPRPDGRTTPMMLYAAIPSASGCAPLAVLSHGAGGSEDGLSYLAQALAKSGFTAVVMGHRESGLPALREKMRSYGYRDGIQALVADPKAEQARLLDVSAALTWANQQCRPPFRVLLGHSMGAETVMLEAGARNALGIPSPPTGQDRFDAYVALSPEGPGIVFPEHAWTDIRKPFLDLTGTRDQSLKGGPASRKIPWQELPGDGARKCHWLGVVTDATHMNFGGNGAGAEHVDPLVIQTVESFLSGARKGSCTLPTPSESMTLQAK